MNFYLITLLLLCISSKSVTSESTKDVNDIDLKSTTKISSNDFISTQDTWEMNPALKSLWVYRPPSIQTHQSDEQPTQYIGVKPPHLVTRLTKPLTFGFDPFFNKGYFEPFERRQKPVTLVSFRKNGIQPRQVANLNSQTSDEVAELQSAFNDISSLWDDVPEVINI